MGWKILPFTGLRRLPTLQIIGLWWQMARRTTAAVFQAFIDANPGKRLIVRKAGAPTQGGGGAVSTIDYYSSCTFHLKYSGTVIESNSNEMWQGAPVFLFAAGVTGFQIDSGCMGCAIRDIEEVGGGKPAYNANACYSSGNAFVYPFTCGWVHDL